MKKTFITALSIIMMVAGVAGATNDTTTVYSNSNFTVDGERLSDAFTADSINQISIDAVIGSNESLSVVLEGYNDTEMTSSQNFTVADDSNSFSVSDFSNSTDTFVLDYSAPNGEVNVTKVNVTGQESSALVSAAAPDGNSFTVVTSIVNWAQNLIGGVISALFGWIP